MRIQDILEAPLGQIETFGEPSGDFSSADVRLVQGEAAVRRIANAFRRLRETINLYIWLSANLAHLANLQHGKIDPLKFSLAFGRLPEVAPPPSLRMKLPFRLIDPDGSISVVYLSNIDLSRNSFPLTPWILAHRFIHGVSDAYDGERLDPSVRRAFVELRNFRRDHIQALARQFNADPNLIARRIGTYRSARSNIVEEEETLIEELTQFVITGQIRYDLRATVPSRMPTVDTTEFQTGMNELADRLMQSLVGKVVITI